MSTGHPNTISDVERETGLAKDTLRVWERRYDFPQPVRDEFDERIYPAEQVQKLRIIKRLIDSGHRPGKIIRLSMEALQNLALESSKKNTRQKVEVIPHHELQHCLDLCKSHEVEALRRKLQQAQLQMGLRSFVVDLIAPLTTLIGEAWAAGELAVFEEHLYSESVQIVLRNAIAHIAQNSPQTDSHPRIVMTTFPQERHGLGLLMAEALFALDGAYCISLGVQTPILEIVEAALAKRADIVALSFSCAMNTRQVMDGLNELRSRLPGTVAIWAGGCNTAITKRPKNAIQTLSLLDIQQSLLDWRSQHV